MALALPSPDFSNQQVSEAIGPLRHQPFQSLPPTNDASTAVASGGLGILSEDLIREVFSPGESPLGLVIDWSMPLPVISAVIPRSPAARRPALRYGVVLLGINGEKVGLGQRRTEVEQLLTVRPLELILEAPDFNLIGHAASVAWRQQRQASTPSNVKVLSTSLAPSGAMDGSFFDRYPERVPLSRWGNLDTSPALPSVLLRGSPSRTKLVELRHPGAAPEPAHRAVAGVPQPTSLPRSSSDPGLGPALTSGRPGRRGEGGPGATGRARLDPACAAALDSGRPLGPGPPAEWPLGHEHGRACRLRDLELVRHPDSAYEVGFRGLKRDPPSELELHFPELAAPERPMRARLVDQISCDVCGVALATTNPRDLDFPSHSFYFCKQCKKHGRRFEMCTACHAMTVLQSEGKHSGPMPHPHYSHCEHKSLARVKDLRAAYPGPWHLRFAFCDHCGERVGKAKSEIYICLQCPEVRGLRFELCTDCAHVLSSRGRGIDRLRFR